MNQPSLKLTTYFGERQRAVADVRRRAFLADAMLDLFDTREIAASVMLRGIASFGPRHVLRTDESLSLSEDPPVAIAAVDVESKISGLVDEVVAMTGHGLVTLERARLVSGNDLLDVGADDAVKLTVYVGRQERIGGLPAIPRGVRSAASTGILRWRSLFGCRRHRARRALSGCFLQPQCQRSADDHLGRDGGAGFHGGRRAQRRRTAGVADRRTGAVMQTGRRVVRDGRIGCRRPTIRDGRCGKS